MYICQSFVPAVAVKWTRPTPVGDRSNIYSFGAVVTIGLH